MNCELKLIYDTPAISWDGQKDRKTEGRTEVKQYTPLGWSGGIIKGCLIHRCMRHVFQISPFHSIITHHKGILISEYCTQLWITWTHKNLP